MSQGLVRDLVAHLGGLLAIVRRHGEDLAIDRVGPGVRPAIHLDVDRVARHATAPWYERQDNCGSWCIARSPLLSNKRDGVFDASEHTLLAATEPLALGSREAACIQFPFLQDRELHLARQCRMCNDVLGFDEKGSRV